MRKRRHRNGPWLALGAGLGLAALAIIVLVAPAGQDATARASITVGSARMSDAELTAALHAGASIRAIADATGVPTVGLTAALDVHRLRSSVLVEYRADRTPDALRAVTTLAVARVADALAGAVRREADDRVRAAKDTATRATGAIEAHERSTGVTDAEQALADAGSELIALQASRDEAVAAKSESASVLQEQVAVAQQRYFDLRAVATRRAALVRNDRRAADAVEAAVAAREQVLERVDARTPVESDAVVEPGTSGPPPWRLGLAAVLFALATVAIVVAVIGSIGRRGDRSPPRRRPRPLTPRGDESTPPVAPDGTSRMELDEIARRLDALETGTVEHDDDAPAGDGRRVDQRS